MLTGDSRHTGGCGRHAVETARKDVPPEFNAHDLRCVVGSTQQVVIGGGDRLRRLDCGHQRTRMNVEKNVTGAYVSWACYKAARSGQPGADHDSASGLLPAASISGTRHPKV